jgi:Na+/H+ antiporter NhaD/arsenite permease-like protein
MLVPGLAHAQEGGMPSSTDPVSQGIVAAILVSVFVLLSLEAAHRVVVVLGAVAVLWLVTYFTPWHLLSFEGTVQALDLNVLVLLASMMAVVGVLKTTGVFEWAVARLLQRSRGQPLVVMALIAWFTAIASAFLDNVTTVIFVTPMALGIARRMKIRPEALLLPMVMALNIGGTATLIGDPPNIMIGSGAHLSFNDFLADLTVPCAIMIFWLLFYSRRYFREDFRGGSGGGAAAEVAVPELVDPLLARWMIGICGLILLGFLTHAVTGMPPAVPATIGAAAALVVQDRLYLRKHRPSAAERLHGILTITEKDIEWPTLSFFGFLFIIVGAAVHTGLIGTVAHGLQWAIASGSAAMGLSPQGTLLFAALLICWASGFFSAIVDNIPFVAVSIPIVAQLATTLTGNPMALWWGLSLGACLGGNGTAIGASANVTTIGLAERGGVRISFGAFTRYGATVAAGTLVIASIYLALFVHLGKLGALLSLGSVLALLLAAETRRARRPSPAWA